MKKIKVIPTVDCPKDVMYLVNKLDFPHSFLTDIPESEKIEKAFEEGYDVVQIQSGKKKK